MQHIKSSGVAKLIRSPETDLSHFGESPRGVVDNVLDCEIILSEFELHSRYYVHFWANTLGNNVNSYISLALGKILFFYKNGFGIK